MVDEVRSQHINACVQKLDEELICIDNVSLLICDIRVRISRLYRLVQDWSQGYLKYLEAVKLECLN